MDAGAMISLRDVTAGGAHGVFYFGNRVCRAGGKLRVVAVQHRDVVVMIARGENVFARDVDQTRELAERRALVIIGVTKAKVNGVALVIEFRLFGPCFVDESRYPIHFFIARSNNAGRAFWLVNHARFRFLIHEIDHLRDDGRGRSEKLGVFSRAALIPVAEGFPWFSVLSRTENIALARQDEV